MRNLCTLLLVLTSITSFGQKFEDAWVEVRGKMGFLAAHRSIMGHLPTNHAYALEVSYLLQTKNRKNWHTAYNHPTLGVTGFAGSAGNNELLGYYFGAYGFVNLPFVNRKHYMLSAKLGCGLAYGTKYYNPETNILGMAVSTPISAQIVLALEQRFKFGNHSITAGIDMTHFSNAATKVPNLGLNLPYVSLGYGYRIHRSIDTTVRIHDFVKSWEFGAMAIASRKEVFPTGGRKYPIFGLNIFARRYFRPKTGMEVSFDIMSNQSIMDYHSDVPKRQMEIIQLGVFVGYLLPFDKFHLITGMGVYVRDKFKPDELLYHRVGMRYVFNNGININLVLKSHWARADYAEFGLGYTFKR